MDGGGVYRLVLRDELGDRFATHFIGMSLDRTGGNTILTGVVSDQAHLISLIQQVQSLGLELISVAEVADANPEGQS